jgi:signal transduction histidine kinase
MTDWQKQAKNFERAFEIQKKARERAEQLLEDKSRELFLKNESLEEALAKLVKQQQQIVIQERLAALGQVGAGMAHELNNPNAFIQNNIETLNEYVQSLLGAVDKSTELSRRLLLHCDAGIDRAAVEREIDALLESSEYFFIKEDLPPIIEESLKGTQRINEIATGLRSFVEPDLSNLQATDINQCIRDSLHLIAYHTAATKIELDLGEISEVEGISVLLAQAFANLIQNACESEPKSRVVTVKSYINQRTVDVTITDDGQGMAQDTLKKVFAPFYSGSGERKGLGMPIAQNIINQHKGRIEIKSTENKGTTVTVKIPLMHKGP